MRIPHPLRNTDDGPFPGHAAPATLIELLRRKALQQPHQKVYTFLEQGEIESGSLSFQELDRQARAIATLLRNCGASGERALLLYQPGLEYIAAFFGCLYAGVVAVPCSPPKLSRPMPRLQAIITDAQAKVALTTVKTLAQIERRSADTPELKSLRWQATDACDESLAEQWCHPSIDGETLAFLQYTSGSTASPKGVMVTHANLLHTLADIDLDMGHTNENVMVTWLPIFHDMGLIYGVLQPVYNGFPCYLMSPTSFLQRPLRWLEAISRYGGTHSAAPNFAYDLCVQKSLPAQREALNLSSWVVAINAAEPIRPQTIERFAEAFAASGFRRKTFCGGYGLAEATLKVSLHQRDNEPVFCALRVSALEQQRIEEVPPGDDSQTFVGCGVPGMGTKVVIVKPDTRYQCAPAEVGEIWVSSSSVAEGYWNRPDETERTFRAYIADTGEGPFLRTGDLGFIRQEELFITGRLKDLIIIRGLNHYPQDIELTVEESHPSLRRGCGAVFTVDTGSIGPPRSVAEERLIVMQEVDRSSFDSERIKEVTEAIRQAVAEQHELRVYAVALIKTGSILKTSSNKIQRRACRAAYLAGALKVIGISTLDDASAQSVEAPITRETLLAAPLDERQPLLWCCLQQHVADVLSVAPNLLGPQRHVKTLGLDSLMAVELKNRLDVAFGLNLPMTKFLENITLAQLSAQIMTEVVAPPPDEDASREPSGSGKRVKAALSPPSSDEDSTQSERAVLTVPAHPEEAASIRFRAAHEAFEEQAQLTPYATALICGDAQLTYAELNGRANQLARYLQRGLGVTPDVRIGLYLANTPECLIGLLAIWKAGATCLPLAASASGSVAAFSNIGPVLLPHDRLKDLGALKSLEGLELDSIEQAVRSEDENDLLLRPGEDHPALIIAEFADGSRGPERVRTHRHLSDFFAQLDGRVGCDERDTLLSGSNQPETLCLLEWLWTLTRGARVVLLTEQEKRAVSARSHGAASDCRMQFSLFYFSSNEAEFADDKYELFLEGAKFADQHGFSAIWTPERHFHAFGGLYPNPSVLSAALAMITKRIRLRAGSVVLPLHNPVRVAEEWAVVDNLSNGRVDIAFATGWNPNDFVLSPDLYATRRESTFTAIETVRQLWRGEVVKLRNGIGNEVEVRIYPLPKQVAPPIWITCTGSAERFQDAGAIGANVLTALLFQKPEELAENIAHYRRARAQHGHDPESGLVTLMLHTFVGEDLQQVRAKVREPFTEYLKTSVDLWRQGSKSLDELSESERADLLSYAFERYFETSALMGTPATCLKMVNALSNVGVNEIACLIDFGVDTDSVLASLHSLKTLSEHSEREPGVNRRLASPSSTSLDQLMQRHRVSLLHCAPALRRHFANMSKAGTPTSLRLLMTAAEEEPERSGADGTNGLHPITQQERYRFLYEQASALASEGTDADRTESTVSVGQPARGDLLPRIEPQPADRNLPFPLTDVQQAYWIGRNGEYTLGNVAAHAYIEIDSLGLDLERLNRAWQRLIARHEMLRAIVLPDGQQQILDQVPSYRFKVADLRGENASQVEAGLDAIRQQMSHQVLPTDQWPLFDVRASLLNEDRTRLHFGLDLLVTDLRSAHIIFDELQQLYTQPERALPTLEISFRDYVLAETAFRRSITYQRAWEYWQARLDILPPAPELPLARSPEAITQPRFVRRTAQLDPQVWSQLKGRAAQAGLTASTILCAAYAEVLARWSKSRSLTLNLTLFNRLAVHPQVKDLVGDFTSLSLLGIDASAGSSFEERARQLQEQLWRDLDHRYVSGVRVLRELARRQGRDKAVMPVIFTSALGHTNDAQGRPPMAWLGNRVYGISQTPQVWLDNQVYEDAGTLVLNWDAVEELFPDGLLDSMFSAYHTLLLGLALDDSLWHCSSLPLVPAAHLAARAHINDTSAPLSELLLHELFERQASAQPDAVALINGAHRLTYAELERLSNRVARWLRERGARPNQLVGVVMRKGWEQVVGVLGVLK
ncbi:MAG: MupA/Atu3671 family FMN-dependent luciferase-like monooxygenase, partial [Pyrinomonadaceae bacterium]